MEVGREEGREEEEEGGGSVAKTRPWRAHRLPAPPAITPSPPHRFPSPSPSYPDRRVFPPAPSSLTRAPPCDNRGSRKKIAKAKAAGLSVGRRPQVVLDNPFERKVQRVKHEVLGRKVKGHEGKPSQSRSRAYQKVR